MALVQDPCFWKRFSTAVHLDEEEKQSSTTVSPDGRPAIKHSYVLYPSPSLSSPPPTPTSPQHPLISPFAQHNPATPHHAFNIAQTNPPKSQSWLDRQKKKKSRRTLICWIFWIVLAFLVTSVVVAVLLLKRYGIIGGHGPQPDPANAGSYSSGGNGP